ncbi:hypothetical protein [Steroidobacter denitrificans]|uniref:hypothetical protein n=1 Tax=Steroidobacter denitrificans TaxID=465721 RepID=UPI0012ED6E30|nr:hypothetical protein [Steroidobacter denitrificans]
MDDKTAMIGKARRASANRLLMLAALTALAALPGCGGGSGSEAGPGAGVGADAGSARSVTDGAAGPAGARDGASASRSDAGVDETTSRMARAVGAAKPGAAVDIRYEILNKPAVGVPVEMQIALVPSVGVDSLDAKIGGMDGITLAGDLSVRFEQVEPGQSYRHTVSLLPDRTGIFYVTVTATTQIHGQDLARTFSIPFAVGEAVAQQKASAPVAEATGNAFRDTTGETIESMPAQENRGE